MTGPIAEGAMVVLWAAFRRAVFGRALSEPRGEACVREKDREKGCGRGRNRERRCLAALHAER